MSLPTAEEITNLYLYGTTTKPADLTSDSIIEPRPNAVITVDGDEYMNTGPGRFANPANSLLVQAFFETSILPPGTYSESRMRGILGVQDNYFDIQQKEFDDGNDDYAERAYIWGSTAFEVDDGAIFIVTVDGQRYIDNFGIVPLNNGDPKFNGQNPSDIRYEEDFDFSTDSILNYLGNTLFLEDRIDPFRIGQKVNIDITRVTQFTTYSLSDYENDKVKLDSEYTVGLDKTASEIYALTEKLFLGNGPIAFLDHQNRPIVYGNDSNNNLSISDAEDPPGNILSENQSYSDEFVSNGVVFVAGYGNDVITGGENSDLLLGGVGDDTLEGKAGNDYLEGNQDADLLSGGTGKDTLKGGTGNDTLYGGENNGSIHVDDNEIDILEGGVGNDVYYVGHGDVIDDIDRTSQNALIDFNGVDVRDTYEQVLGDAYKNEAKGLLLMIVGNDAIIRKVNGAEVTLFTIRNFKSDGQEFNNGDFGITLTAADTSDPASTTLTIFGDRMIIDQDPETPGVQAGYDSLGNIITDPNVVEARADNLNGSTGNDEILAGDLNDTVRAKAGDDTVEGGAGDDVLEGGAGIDRLNGGADRDWVLGNEDDDIIEGGTETDILLGGEGDDQLFADSQIDINTVFDSVEAGDSRDWISGGAGDDIIIGSTGQNGLAGGAGNDLIAGGAGDDHIFGDSDSLVQNFDWTVTHTNDEYIYSPMIGSNIPIDNGEDILHGGDGNDIIWGQGGADVLIGGEGNDELVGDSNLIDAANHGVDILDGGGGDDFLWGQGGADVLIGGEGNDELQGDDINTDAAYHGDDTLDGGAGDDSLWGQGGADSLSGGDGNDHLYGDDSDLGASYHGDDYLDGGAGDDYLWGNGGADILIGGDGNDTILGGTGADTILGGNGNDLITGEEDNDTIFGGDGVDELQGGTGDDYLYGEADADRLFGEDGNDNLFGGDGVDELQGGTGDDYLYGEADADRLFGEDGNDNLFGGDGADELIAGAGDDVLDGGAGDDTIWGESGTDTISGGAGNDTLVGGSEDDTYVFGVGDGADTIIEQNDSSLDVLSISGAVSDYTAYRGGSHLVLDHANGNDSLTISNWFASSDYQLSQVSFSGGTTWSNSEAESTASLIVKGTELSDVIYGTDSSQNIDLFGGNDTVYAQDGDDIITGGAGDDNIYAGDGDDVITGGVGNDTLSGQNGNDTYIFNIGDGHDLISNADSTGFDTLHFGSDILPVNMFYERQGDDLVISHSITVDGALIEDSVTIRYWYLGSVYQLDQITFYSDPETTLTAQELSDLGIFIDHTHLFKLGDGYRVIEEWGGQDILTIDSSILPNEISTRRSGTDLVLDHLNGVDSITITDWFDDTQKQIERIDFAFDGSFWLADDVTTPLLNPVGTTGDDVLTSGDAYSEILQGLEGNDSLYGNGGDDTLVGGTGNDALYGGFGTDTYVFDSGDGIDTLVDELEPGWNYDSVRFGDAVDVNAVTTSDEGYDLRVIYGAGDEILIKNYYHPNTSNWDRTISDFKFVINGTSGNDTISGSDLSYISDSDVGDLIYGFGGDDIISAGAGDDYVYGGDGNDTIYTSDGADKLYGGAGNDTLGTYWALTDVNRTDNSNTSFSGGAGDDIIYGTLHRDYYYFDIGDGIDTIYEQPYSNGVMMYSSSDDRLILGEGISPDSISVDYSGYDLIISVTSTDELTIKDYFSRSYTVEYISFSDGTLWGYDEVVEKAYTQVGTEGDDTLTAGYYLTDSLYGMGGNDTLNGNSGNDLLDGGIGNDFLNGSYDNDTYIFDRGYGRDVISDNRTSSSGLNSVQFGAGVTATDISYSREVNDLVLTINDTGDQLVINDFLISADSRKFSFSFSDSSQLPTNQQMYDDLIHITGDGTANTLVGSDGYDVIDGAGGDDVLIGNMGDDLLEGGTGNDLYQYALGDGRDTINNYDLTDGRVDAVVFDASVTTSNVQARRNNDNLKLSMSDGGELLITNHFVGDTISGYAINEVRFNDGTVWNVSDIQTKVLEATAGSDYLYGLSSADTLSGLTGNDTIIGNGGADTLSGDEGNDILDGGTGNDYLEGGSGSDIYCFGFGYGTDIINNNDDSTRYDKIELVSGITSKDVKISRAGDNLVLTLTSTGDQISVNNHFLSKGKNKSCYIDAVHFSDGSSWSKADIDSYISLNPDGNYTLNGTSGNDDIVGFGGDDVLTGGAGNDTLDGGTGSDTYVYSLGDGNDVINNHDADPSKTDAIELSSGIAVSDVVAERMNDDLVLNMSDGGSITVSNYFVQNGTAGYAVDEVRFNDGTVWSISDVLAMLIQNEAPIASDDAGSVSEDNSVVFLVSDLIANDSDADGDPLSITSVSNAVNGAVVLDEVAGTITFTPGENYYGPASFEYILSDGLQTDTALVNIDITPVDDAPVAQTDTAQVERDSSVVINIADLLANDTELDGELLSVVSVGNALNGAAVYDDIAGTVSFTPNAGYVGGASFDYTITDGNSTSSAVVSVNVTMPNSAPTVIDDAVTTTQDNAIVVNASDLLANDSDVDGDTIQVVGVQNATNGTAIFDGVAKTVTFTPDPYYTGLAQFEYVVSDGMDQSTGLVNVDVTLDTTGAIVGTSGNDTLSGGRQGETFYGLSGDDTITGGRGNDQLIGGAGNDTLLGDGGHDTYVAGVGAGIDVIDNSTSSKTDNDILHMVGGDPYNLWFSQDGNDLLVDVVGTNDQVQIHGWYANSSNELDSIHTADSILISNNVNQLVSAMAAFSVPAGEGAEIPQYVRDQIDPVIAVSWQSA